MKTVGKLLLPMVPIVIFGMGCQDQPSPANEDNQKVDAKRIPLESIYSTNGQKGLKVLDQGRGDGAFPIEMRELHQRSSQIGASNIFLARGEDIAAAVKATWAVFTGGHSVGEPVNADPRSRSDQFWLVAYLGVSGSDPPQWLVKSVELTGKEIHLTFAKARPRYVTLDNHPYFTWAPVGKLEPGTYTLQLFDEDQEHVVLFRRVKVRAK